MSEIIKSVDNQQGIYLPVFFRLVNKSDKIALTTLIEKNPQIVIYDDIRSQLSELIASKFPAGIDENELSGKVNHILSKNGSDAYGVWVYYSWLNKLVHILDEAEFIELRTNRNLNKITKEERDILASKVIGIIGLSVGQSIALTLTMERGCGELRLADFDKLELSNLNRIRTPLYNLGEYKVVATAREIAEIDPLRFKPENLLNRIESLS